MLLTIKVEYPCGEDGLRIADAEGVSDRHVGRMLRLSYLAPTVLEKLLIAPVPPAGVGEGP